ncbi:MAG TPA: hypothetical protein VMV41_14195 [Cellulomonadaceae bacterium]|nr:hypothetical protein [Cellulomonadaceae bacterium]
MLRAAVVARGWSDYLRSILDLPSWLAGDHARPDIVAIAVVLVLAAGLVRGSTASSGPPASSSRSRSASFSW